MTDSKPELVNLGDSFRGFYRATDGDWAQVLSSGLVVLDTNALLDLYRLSPTARDELFSVLEALRERLFVPHQVATEFHRRRLDAVADRIDEIRKAADALDEQAAKVRGLLRTVSAAAHAGDAAVDELQSSFASAFKAAKDFVQSVGSEYDLQPDRLLSRENDPVLRRLESLLAGRVAPRPSHEQLEVDIEEAKRRADEGLPPGFKDAKKDENPYGDYLWWAEVVRHASPYQDHVLLVCNDVAKGDWTYEKRGMRIGPSTALVEEMTAVTGQHLLLCTTAELLRQAASHLQVPVSDNTVTETRNLPESRATTRRPTHRSPNVPSVWLRELIGIDPQLLQPWVGDGYLQDLNDPVWRWTSVRRAAFIAAAIQKGMDADVVDVLLEALHDRTAGRTQLVVSQNGWKWVRKKDLPKYLSELSDDPLAVFDRPQIEGALWSTYSRLPRLDEDDEEFEGLSAGGVAGWADVREKDG